MRGGVRMQKEVWTQCQWFCVEFRLLTQLVRGGRCDWGTVCFLCRPVPVDGGAARSALPGPARCARGLVLASKAWAVRYFDAISSWHRKHTPLPLSSDGKQGSCLFRTPDGARQPASLHRSGALLTLASLTDPSDQYHQHYHAPSCRVRPAILTLF